MSRSYANPPLVEAVCEFRFTSASTWDWTIPGLIYEQVKDEFPVKQQTDVVELIAAPTAPTRPVPNVSTRVQFFRGDRTALLQVGPQLFAVNHVRPYPKWPEFKRLVVLSLKTYLEVAKPEALAQIALRYVNKMDFGPTGIDLDDYFSILPKIDEPVSQRWQSFVVVVNLAYDDPASLLRLSCGSAPPEEPDRYPVILDLSMVNAPAAAPGLDAVEGWLETAHARVEEAFETSITEKTRTELFQEVFDRAS
jgi:uncharacterized protein (TIGR04255 family)